MVGLSCETKSNTKRGGFLSMCKDILSCDDHSVKVSLKEEIDQLCATAEIGTGEILEDVSASGRVRPWAEMKKQNLKMADLFNIARGYAESDLFGLARDGAADSVIRLSALTRLRKCSDFLYYGILEDGRKKLLKADFCKHRLCPLCTWRKSMKMFHQVTVITNAIGSSGEKVRYLFLTLTIRNVRGDELTHALDTLNKGFAYLTSKSKTFAPAKRLKENLLGYYRATEITYHGEKGRDDFHPHLHVVLAVKPSYFGRGYIKQSEWREIWQQAIGADYIPQVDVKAITMTPNAVAEVSKYPLKPTDLLSEKVDKDKAARALTWLAPSTRGRRFVTFGGVFRKYKRLLSLDDVETGDLVNTDGGGDEKLNFVAIQMYQYHARLGVYIC